MTTFGPPRKHRYTTAFLDDFMPGWTLPPCEHWSMERPDVVLYLTAGGMNGCGPCLALLDRMNAASEQWHQYVLPTRICPVCGVAAEQMVVQMHKPTVWLPCGHESAMARMRRALVEPIPP